MCSIVEIPVLYPVGTIMKCPGCHKLMATLKADVRVGDFLHVSQFTFIGRVPAPNERVMCYECGRIGMGRMVPP